MSLALVLDMAASGFPERVALGSVDDGITFEQLAARVAGGAAVLADRRPKHVVSLGRPGAAFPQLLFASALAGVPFVPLNYRLARQQLRELLTELDAPLVVADDDYVELLPPDIDVLTTAGFLAAAGTTDPIARPLVHDDDPAVLLFTSGTTGTPKAVVLSHAHLTSYIFSTVDFGNAAADDAALVSVPPYHVAAVGSAVSNVYAGRRVVYLPDFDPNQWLRIVRESAITSAMVVPTMLARIVDVIGEALADTPTLRLVTYGGARMPGPVLSHAMRAFPQTGFCNAYGLTETSSTIALLAPDDHREAFGSADPLIRARLDSVGRPVPGIEVAILGKGGEPVATGTTGRLWVRGRQVSGEYRGTDNALSKDGWFDTHDLAHQDVDGFLFIEGRSDDTIIRGGENIAPAEIEDVLIQHPGIKDVAIVGLPDDEWGEKICAVVVAHPDVEITDDDVRQYVRDRLRGSRTPDEVRWRTELPHTPTGKLLRRHLVVEISA